MGLTLVSASHADETTSAGESTSTGLGTSVASTSAWDGATIEVNALDRSTTGEYTQLVWTLHNESDTRIRLQDFGNRTYLYPGSTLGSGLVLIDEEHGIRYHPYIDADQDCLCAGSDYVPSKFQLTTHPGTQNTYWASYQLSEDTDTVTVEIPGFLPIADVPVG
ncbi:hypothetical protein [Marinitenerispora sediminis]|uniref:hypothetical protein n=1 Tax=Marinitenerispora sediminis TaxID=1931232 RepID=UPI0011C05EE3|nr:hypothetical protein [Marinitenerispora sediminis]